MVATRGRTLLFLLALAVAWSVDAAFVLNARDGGEVYDYSLFSLSPSFSLSLSPFSLLRPVSLLRHYFLFSGDGCLHRIFEAPSQCQHTVRHLPQRRDVSVDRGRSPPAGMLPGGSPSSACSKQQRAISASVYQSSAHKRPVCVLHFTPSIIHSLSSLASL